MRGKGAILAVLLAGALAGCSDDVVTEPTMQPQMARPVTEALIEQLADLVEGRPVDAERVHVGRDGVRQEAVGEHGARRLERERALAMPDVEQHAALACFDHRAFHLALRG